MRRRDLSKALVASATGATLLPQFAQGQTVNQPYYPRSDAETAARVTPTNYSHPPGSVQRYGADPSGAVDSSAAWSNAIKANCHVFDNYPGGGSYRFDSEVIISRYPITIEGSAKNIGSGTGGTQLTLATAAGPGAACLRTTEFATSVRVEKIRFAWQGSNTGQIGLRFAGDLRASRVLDCGFLANKSPGTNVVGIQFDGTGIYTGDITVRNNYFSALLIAVDVQGVCSTVRILENEMYGNVPGATSYAVRIANKCSQTIVAFNDMEGWTRGIYSQAAYVKQVANTYEQNEHNFEWVRGSGNARIWNISIAETFVSGGAPIYPVNEIDACAVLSGPGYADFDGTTVNAARGFRERLRTALLGEYATDPFVGSDYSARGGGSWSVRPEHQTTLQYTRIGLTMLLNWRIDASTLSGSPRDLEIKIPQFRSAQKAVGTTCYINDGTAAIGRAEVEMSGRAIRILKLDGAAFADGSFTTYGQISFEIN